MTRRRAPSGNPPSSATPHPGDFATSTTTPREWRETAAGEHADVTRKCAASCSACPGRQRTASSGSRRRPTRATNRMAETDPIHLESPAHGSRKIARELTGRCGLPTTRLAAVGLMRDKGIRLRAPQPSSSMFSKHSKRFPYLLRDKAINLTSTLRYFMGIAETE